MMRYYIDDKDGFYTVPDDYIQPENWTAIGDAEATALSTPTLSASQIKDGIKAQIVSLEAGQYMGRGEREAWLALVVAQAVAQGYTEPQMYAVNPFYKHTKDLNTQIVALRAQL